MPYRKYRIVIIEPSEIIREGLKLLLERHSDFHVVASCSGLQPFTDRHVKPEDFQIMIFNPAIIQFHKAFDARDLFVDYPNIYLVALLTQYISEDILRSFDGILNIYDAGSLLPKKILKIIETADENSLQKTSSVALSNREKDVLICLATGLTNKEAADKLCISMHTVIAHRKAIVRKTAIKTVSGLTLYALFNNLISQNDLL